MGMKSSSHLSSSSLNSRVAWKRTNSGRSSSGAGGNCNCRSSMLLRPTATTASARPSPRASSSAAIRRPICSAVSAAEGSVSQGMRKGLLDHDLAAPPGGNHQADFTRIPFQGKKLGHGNAYF